MPRAVRAAICGAWIAAVGLLAGCSVFSPAVDADDEASLSTPATSRPGRLSGGRVQLPNQWILDPAGTHIAVGDFPICMEFSPDGRWLAIAHAGYGTNDLTLLQPGKKPRIVSRAVIPGCWYGLAWHPDGDRVYVMSGTDDVVYEFQVVDGYIGGRRDLDFFRKDQKLLPGGPAITRDGLTLYTANNRHHSVGVIDVASEAPQMEFIGLPEDSFPYACALTPDDETLYVSLWGAAKVAEIDVTTRKLRRLIETDDHPNEMIVSADGDLLYVACANENSVAVIDTETGRVRELLCSALYPGAPEGSTPNSLALSPDGDTLYVANADNNNLAVFAVGEGERTKSRGFIPTGWYPTGVRVDPDTHAIYVLNGKGDSSKANVNGPNPTKPGLPTTQYIGGLFTGTLSTIPPPSQKRLANYTARAFACAPFLGLEEPTTGSLTANPIPSRVGDPSPIKYCVYIIKENRTYDHIFGDVEKGNGDPSLCLFPEQVTPNHHAIAEQFVLLDNFYVESEVSADGHEWTTAAYATDFVEKNWPGNYGHKGRWDRGYPAEGGFDSIARPTAGYIWDRCAEAGITYRSYGEFIENGKTPADPGTANVKSLEGHFDPLFRGYDMKYKDIDRAKRFLADIRDYEQKQGDIPRFIVIRLPNDHTEGTKKDCPTPMAHVADNDQGLGMILEGLSHSRFWPEMAVFVVEDDAQNGSDHVDAHRTVALVASPWCRRGVVDSSMYSTSSMLRTIELILGLKPMSQFDAAALPMYNSFCMSPDVTPYVNRPARVDLNARNPVGAYAQEEMASLNLEKEDAADDIRFNEIIWKAVRGADSPMPPPRHAAFVFNSFADEDDDDD